MPYTGTIFGNDAPAIATDSSAAMDLLSVMQIIEGRLRGIGSFWIKAEVAGIMTNVNGHTYLTLIQKKEDGGFSSTVASVKAVIWKARSVKLLTEFTKVTGKALAAGMTVVVHAEVLFNKIYGLQLSIDDIDMDFSLGQREKERRETLKYLTDSGLIHRQGLLLLPFLPERIAVVSSSTAAGYGDFMKHLTESPRGFVFNVETVPAVMQGETAPESMVSAISRAVNLRADLILVLRGGGAESDLFCFDDRKLCEAICLCHVPVFCAVGHEKDHHIIDDAAARSFKTPTALADHIIQWFSDVEDSMVSVKDAIAKAASSRMESGTRAVMTHLASIRGSLARAVTALESLTSGPHRAIVLSLADRKNRMQAEIKHLLLSAGGAVTNVAVSSAAAVTSLRQSIIRGADMRIHVLDAETGRMAGNVAFMSKMRLGAAEAAIREQLLLIEAADPRKVLSQGYVLAVDEKGNILKGASARTAGDTFILRHLDGRWDCSVDKVTKEGDE